MTREIDYPEGRSDLDHIMAHNQHLNDSNDSTNSQCSGGWGGPGGGGTQVSKRSSQSSSCSAYSEPLCPLQSEEIDLSGLVESIVDSDEEDLTDSNEGGAVRDRVRECLEKDPTERTEEDIETLLEFVQRLQAFNNMTLWVRRALCHVMVFAVVEKANTVVMNDGEELDSWSVLINGVVQIDYPDKPPQLLHTGDSFGILPTMEKLYHVGVMRTKVDDCQFVCITQTDYYHIQHEGRENMTRVIDPQTGELLMVTDLRQVDSSTRLQILIRGTPEVLMNQLISESCLNDPTYIEDFLLMHRTFIETPLTVLDKLLKWFEEEEDTRDRVTRVIILWVNNHYSDFEQSREMLQLLEIFEGWLESGKMYGQLRLLNIACAAKARPRNITLARPSRDDILPFSILGGLDRGCPIYISKVEKDSRAEEVGLKRADQILEVNGHNFTQLTHARALDILRSTTHLSLTVKSNFLGFKEMLESSVSGNKKPQQRGYKGEVPPPPPLPPPPPQPQPSPAKSNARHFVTHTAKKNIHRALVKMNIINKSNSVDTSQNDGAGTDGNGDSPNQLYPPQPNHEEPSRLTDYPEHVLKVYKPDQTYKYLLVHKETSAHEVVMLALQEFGMSEPSWHFSLCEVSVSEGGIIKNKRLPDQLQNLAENLPLNSRYYLKTNGQVETLVTDELAQEMLRECQVSLLQLTAAEVALQLSLQDFQVFKQIEPTEYVDDLFSSTGNTLTPYLSLFQQLVNKEMFWVITEVCSEQNPVRRAKVIKQFIKIARHCKECKNFNSMFAVISGLSHGAVARLKISWDRVPNKYLKLYRDLEAYMDPSRNMSKYRHLINSSSPPMIPFFPIIKKDLTFIHIGNDTRVDGLINFEKLRMIAKEIRSLTNMCSSPYDLLTMLELGGQPASNALVSMNQLTQPGTGTVKRRKKSVGTPNPRKMFDEAQMIRRVKTYLNNMKVVTDEDNLMSLSLECEGGSGSTSQRKRQPSPTLSTASSASSASDQQLRKQQPKFGSASPQAVRKLLSLSEGSRPRLSPGGGGRKALPVRHERSHSDTPPHTTPCPLPAESSSVTSLSRKPGGSLTSSDSGHSTAVDSEPPLPSPRRHSALHFNLPQGRRVYNVAAGGGGGRLHSLHSPSNVDDSDDDNAPS